MQPIQENNEDEYINFKKQQKVEQKQSHLNQKIFENIPVFQWLRDEFQGIIDQKETSNEEGDERSFLIYREFMIYLSLINFEGTKKEIQSFLMHLKELNKTSVVIDKQTLENQKFYLTAQIFWIFRFIDEDIKNYELKEFLHKFFYQISNLNNQLYQTQGKDLLQNSDFLKTQNFDDKSSHYQSVTLPNMKAKEKNKGYQTQRGPQFQEDKSNLIEKDEEKKFQLKDQNRQSKAFLSAANIMGQQRQSNFNTARKTQNIDDEKALNTFSIKIPQLLFRKLDYQVIKNNILKSRGFLLRKSMKHQGKWTYCFFYIDINHFAKDNKKVLQSFRPKEKLMDRDFMDMIEIKRQKLNEKHHILLIPQQAISNINLKYAKDRYLCMRYSYEEKVLNEILDTFKDAQYLEKDLKSRVTSQVYFKVVLETCELRIDEYKKIQSMQEDDKLKYMSKKSYQKMLLCIDSGRLMIFTLKKKDLIDLEDCEVSIKTKLGLNENNKYMFALNYSRKRILLNKRDKLVLGTDSESSRRDWIFAMQLSMKSQPKMRESSKQSRISGIDYVNELKKQSLFQIALQRQDDIRKSMTQDGQLFQTILKQQAQDIDLPLQFQGTPKGKSPKKKKRSVFYDSSSDMKEDLINELGKIEQKIKKTVKVPKKVQSTKQIPNYAANLQLVQGAQRETNDYRTNQNHEKSKLQKKGKNQITQGSNPYLSAQESDQDQSDDSYIERVESSRSGSSEGGHNIYNEKSDSSSQSSLEVEKVSDVRASELKADHASSIFKSQILDDPAILNLKQKQIKLKRILEYQLLEYEVVGKSPSFEIVGESNQNLLLRFLLHFLFAKHDSFKLSLLEEEENKDNLSSYNEQQNRQGIQNSQGSQKSTTQHVYQPSQSESRSNFINLYQQRSQEESSEASQILMTNPNNYTYGQMNTIGNNDESPKYTLTEINQRQNSYNIERSYTKKNKEELLLQNLSNQYVMTQQSQSKNSKSKLFSSIIENSYQANRTKQKQKKEIVNSDDLDGNVQEDDLKIQKPTNQNHNRKPSSMQKFIN
eukprot:403359095